jgi:hypothetical protein
MLSSPCARYNGIWGWGDRESEFNAKYEPQVTLTEGSLVLF